MIRFAASPSPLAPHQDHRDSDRRPDVCSGRGDGVPTARAPEFFGPYPLIKRLRGGRVNEQDEFDRFQQDKLIRELQAQIDEGAEGESQDDDSGVVSDDDEFSSSFWPGIPGGDRRAIRLDV